MDSQLSTSPLPCVTAFLGQHGSAPVRRTLRRQRATPVEERRSCSQPAVPALVPHEFPATVPTPVDRLGTWNRPPNTEAGFDERGPDGGQQDHPRSLAVHQTEGDDLIECGAE